MRRFTNPLQRCVLRFGVHVITTFLLVIQFISVLHAQDRNSESEESEWTVSVGAGTIVGPVYEGSRSYTLSTVPFLRAIWRDRVQIGPRSITADLLQGDRITVGAGFHYHFGRAEDGTSVFQVRGDDRLDGLGDISGAVGARVYGSYDLDLFTLRARATKYTAGDNNGWLATSRVQRTHDLYPGAFVRPYAGTTWADNDYMNTFFGISPSQSAASGFPTYDMDSGIKDAHVGVTSVLPLNRHWFIRGGAKVQHLLPEVADSPVVEQETSISVLTFLGYRF